MELINEIARRKGLDPELYLADLVSRDLDPRGRVDLYLRIHEELLSEADRENAVNNLVQASEKYWGAVTALLNAIAELRGWEHHSHRDYAMIIERLANELGDNELRVMFDSVEKLHANFYHGFLNNEGFDLRRSRALALINKLKEYINRHKSV